MATLSSTQTDIVSVTTIESATEVETVPVTDLATATVTVITSITESVSATSTPLSVVPLMCKPRGQVFRATVSYPSGIRAMNSANWDTIVAWQYGGAGSAWVLDANGYLELASGTHAAYIAEKDTQHGINNGESMFVKMKPKAEVEAGVGAGTMQRVKGYVNAATNELTMSAYGRHNILECGVAFYLSTNTHGKDVRSDCVLLKPTAA